ncbi:MAG: pitrilysin family protein [Candidatus Nanoarchaeia archaeon]|nr:pitrilysin family protein [Candidatus Nanoarchaeia archaeon]
MLEDALRYEQLQLDNGFKVNYKENDEPTVYVELIVNSGATSEKKDEDGLAHFLEHIVNNAGSKKYSPLEIEKIKNTFGESNASTSLKRTLFYVDSLKDDFLQILDYFSEIVFNQRFDLEKIERERQRVLREISNKLSKPNYFHDKLHKESFLGKNSLMLREVLGNEMMLKSFDIQTIRDFYTRNYNINNVFLNVIGGIPKNIEEIIDSYFGKYRKSEFDKFIIPENKLINHVKFFHHKAPDLLNKINANESNSELILSIPTIPLKNENTPFVDVLNDIFCGNSNSRLFKLISRKEGLAYNIKSLNFSEVNYGELSIKGNIKSLKSDYAIDLIFDVMSQLRETLVSEEELEYVKKRIEYRMYKDIKDVRKLSGMIYLAENYDFSQLEYLEQVKKITPKDIQEAARTYFPKSREEGSYVLTLRDPLKK